MISALEHIKEQFSFRSFLIGLGAVFLIYACLFFYVFLQRETTIETLEKQLATHTVLIEAVGTTNAIEEVVKESAPPPETTPNETAINEDNKSLSELLHGATSGHSLNALIPSPVEGLYEETQQYGRLPVKKGNISPFTTYQKPFNLNRNKHTLGVAVLDYGLSAAISEKILTLLPSSVSLVLSPYAESPDEWQKKARMDGHEIWLGFPVQTQDFPERDPGPKALKMDVSLPHNQATLHWLLGRTTGYAGLAGYTDLALQRAAPMFKTLFEEMFDRGLGFLEINPESPAFISKLAARNKAPYVRGNIALKIFEPDNEALENLKQHILTHQTTLLLIYPTPKNIERLSTWLSDMAAQDINIAPASALAEMSVMQQSESSAQDTHE